MLEQLAVWGFLTPRIGRPERPPEQEFDGENPPGSESLEKTGLKGRRNGSQCEKKAWFKTGDGASTGVPTIANHSAQEFGAQLPCRPQYPLIGTDGKRTEHGIRMIYRGQGVRLHGPLRPPVAARPGRRLAATGGIWHIVTRNGTAREGGVGVVRRRKAPRDYALDTSRARRAGTKTIRKSCFPVPFCAIFGRLFNPCDAHAPDVVRSIREAG